MLNQNFSGFVIILFCVVTWIGIQHLGYVEFGTVGRMMIEGAFRRQLNAQIALQSFERDLFEAANADDCWIVVRNAAQEFGFHHVRLQLGGRAFEYRANIEPLKSWDIKIPITEQTCIELSREFDVIGHATALAPFADMLRRSLSSKFNTSDPSRYRTSGAQS